MKGAITKARLLAALRNMRAKYRRAMRDVGSEDSDWPLWNAKAEACDELITELRLSEERARDG